MKPLILIPFLILMTIASGHLAGIAEAAIYISEVLEEEDQPHPRTLVSVFSSQETYSHSFHLNGVHATVSPDQQHLVYLEPTDRDTDRGAMTWEFVLADTNGKILKDLQTLNKRYKIGKPVERIRWSPDSHHIAVLIKGPKLYPDNFKTYRNFYLVIYDIDQDTIVYAHTKKCPSSDSRCFYDISWFQDSQRLLLSGTGGVHIVNAELKRSQLISTQSSKAYLTANDAQLILMHGTLPAKSEGNVVIYDLVSKTQQSIMTLARFPFFDLVNPDRHTLLFQPFPIRPSTLPMLDLVRAKLTMLKTPEITLVPKTVAPQNRRHIGAIGFTDSGMSYGIYDLDSRRYRSLKSADVATPQGKGAFGLLKLNRLDWFAD